ncbi:retrovirus-related pol polyprotein from transposon TNT 1-94 [Tanacetum coccineum]
MSLQTSFLKDKRRQIMTTLTPAHGHAEDNNNDQAPNASFQEVELINPFCTRVQETDQRSSIRTSSWKSNHASSNKTTGQLVTNPEMCNVASSTFACLEAVRFSLLRTPQVFFNLSIDVEKRHFLYAQEEDGHENSISQWSSEAWYDELSNFLMSKGFSKGTIDPTLFKIKYGDDILLVQIYVDNIIFGSTNPKYSKRFEKLMHSRFEMSLMGEMKFFLGLQIHQSPKGIFINQAKYALEILKKHNMDNCHSIGTPLATKPKLDVDLSGEPVDQSDYRSKIGSLMYLTSSRPDLVQAVCYCACYQARPTQKHLKEVKRIFKYLKGTINMGLWYPKDSGFELTTFSDADHAGCLDTRKSTSGGIQFLGDKLVSWMSKKQNCTAMSSAEAEYVALSASCAQVMWMRTQLQDYGFNYNKIPLYCDSQSAIAISCNPVQHSAEYQLADMFTKALLEDRFKYLVRMIGMRCLTPTDLEVVRLGINLMIQPEPEDLPKDNPKLEIAVLRMKKKCMDKGSKERSHPHNLRQKPGQYICCQNHKLIADIENDIMDPVMQCTTLLSHSEHPSDTNVFTMKMEILLEPASNKLLVGNVGEIFRLHIFDNHIENAIANVIPSQVDASVRSYMSGHILHVHPAQSQTSSVPDQQYQLYLAMKADPQFATSKDIAIWLALLDEDDPHDDAHLEGENSAKRQKTSEYEAYVSWRVIHLDKFSRGTSSINFRTPQFPTPNPRE